MHRAGHEAGSQTIEFELVAPAKDDIMNGRVIRQHTDDDVAFEQIPDLERRLHAERGKLFGAIWLPDIGGNPAAAGGQVSCHHAAHTTEPDKPDATLDRLATASRLNRSIVRRRAGHCCRIDVLLLHS
jgi:hypothetical protein